MSGQGARPILCRLVEALRDVDSWTGETHLQKSAFVLERLARLDWRMGFIIYKYGPFSFRLREQLSELRASGHVELEYALGGYGPRHRLTEKGLKLAKQAVIDRTVLNFVASELGAMGVKELEKVATGLFFLTEPEYFGTDPTQLHRQLQQCKPHLKDQEVAQAFADATELLRHQLSLH